MKDDSKKEPKRDARGRLQKGHGMGRPKGSTNKDSADLRSVFLSVANGLHPDGIEGALLEWAKASRNQTQFWHMMARMLPKAVEATIKDETIGKQLDEAAERLRKLKDDGIV